MTGQWIESVTDWAVRITDWCLFADWIAIHASGQWTEYITDWAIHITDWSLFPDWVSSHARLADPIRPMPNKGKSGHSGLPIALISRLPDWVVQSVLPIAIHRLLHRFYPLASLKAPYGAFKG